MGKNKFWQNVKESRQGMYIGFAAGALVGIFLLPNDINLAGMTQSYGVIDLVKPAGTAVLEWAKGKVIIGTIILGTAIGGLIDYFLPEGWLRKRRR